MTPSSNETHTNTKIPPRQDQPSRSRLAKSKATACTAAIQPLEITTTAVMTSNGSIYPYHTGVLERTTSYTAEKPVNDINPSLTLIDNRGSAMDLPPDKFRAVDHASASESDADRALGNVEMRRKQSHHQHHYHLKSPVVHADHGSSPLGSPLSSAAGSIVTPPISNDPIIFSELPPPIIKGPSEAIVALQDAANDTNRESNRGVKNTGITPISTMSSQSMAPLGQLFESSFFSTVILVQWSNVVGPKVEKVWGADDTVDEKLQILIGRQILNGEVARAISTVEFKWVVLHRQALVCTAFLYQDPTVSLLCSLIFVFPVRYLRIVSSYFTVLRDRVPPVLVEPLIRLRQIYRKKNTTWQKALDFFAQRHLGPFIQSIMNLESVSLPMDCTKMSNSLLEQDSQLFDSPFLAKIVTSHLQTYTSTVVLGSNLAAVNMMINTLGLFLSPEERMRSSHAQKNHYYMPDLYLQGILTQDVEETEYALESSILSSDTPTTIVDLNRLVVKQTQLFPEYKATWSQYNARLLSQLGTNLSNFLAKPDSVVTHTRPDWRQGVLLKADSVAPLVQRLFDQIRIIPVRMRNAYVRQWRRWLLRRAMALIKFIKDKSPLPSPADIMHVMTLEHHADFIILLNQAEKLSPGIIDHVFQNPKPKQL